MNNEKVAMGRSGARDHQGVNVADSPFYTGARLCHGGRRLADDPPVQLLVNGVILQPLRQSRCSMLKPRQIPSDFMIQFVS